MTSLSTFFNGSISGVVGDALVQLYTASHFVPLPWNFSNTYFFSRKEALFHLSLHFALVQRGCRQNYNSFPPMKSTAELFQRKIICSFPTVSCFLPSAQCSHPSHCETFHTVCLFRTWPTISHQCSRLTTLYVRLLLHSRRPFQVH